jgi:DNA-nicking Smr family endonuclease
MGKRKLTRQQRRTCPDHRRPSRLDAPGKGLAAASLGKGQTASSLCRREQSESHCRAEEESFASLFGKGKSLQQSFSELMESYLVAPDRDTPQEKRPTDHLREYPPPQEELDLHRRTGPEAQRGIESFIQTARGRGLLTLRIITGRGLHSNGPAVLPGVAESKLLELKERGLVLAYRWEKEKKDRSGAIIVYLRQPYVEKFASPRS